MVIQMRGTLHPPSHVENIIKFGLFSCRLIEEMSATFSMKRFRLILKSTFASISSGQELCVITSKDNFKNVRTSDKARKLCKVLNF